MKSEYLSSVSLGNNIIEVLNPSTGQVHSVISILSYDFDLNKNLVVSGIDMTEFFSKNQYIAASIGQFDSILTSHLQKNKPMVHTFSSHFPFTIYTSE